MMYDRRRYKMRDLPVGYDRLEYVYNLTSRGRQNFPLTFSLHDVIIDFKHRIDDTINDRCFFITRTNVGNSTNIPNTFRWVLYYSTSNNTVNWYNSNGSQKSCTFEKDHNVHVWHYDFTTSLQTIMCDNVSTQVESTLEETPYTYHLYHSSRNYYESGWFYYLKISKHDGTVLYNLIPVKRKSDGVVGLYNKADGTFWYNENAPLFEDKPSET